MEHLEDINFFIVNNLVVFFSFFRFEEIILRDLSCKNKIVKNKLFL